MGTEPHCLFFKLRLQPPHPRRLAPLSGNADIGGVFPLPQEKKKKKKPAPIPGAAGALTQTEIPSTATVKEPSTLYFQVGVGATLGVAVVILACGTVAFCNRQDKSGMFGEPSDTLMGSVDELGRGGRDDVLAPKPPTPTTINSRFTVAL